SLQVRINDNPNLKYEIKENENGHYISITSRDVVKEPVMNFSLEVTWSKGHLIREYSLLIDPR
ncbi:MAG: pilus assembly protein FimV, partial [Gammaproteobacteria bacterium]|nr:pilus assembly protein FimV [Gammaproteobacteria bacterium]